jgi:peroxiredoxin
MQKIKYFLWTFCFLSCSLAGAQDVTISGKAPSYNGREISAYSYKDLITYTPIKIGSCQVNDSGRFSMEITGIKNTQYLYLSINNQRGSIYVSPGSKYHILFPPPDTTKYENPFTTHLVDLTFLVTDSTDINNLIIDFSDQYGKFMESCYIFFLKKEGIHYLDSFYVAMQHRYAAINNDFFKGSVQYTIADNCIDILEGEKTIGEKYLKNKSVLYHNYEYMKFFNDFYDDYVEQFGLTPKGADINKYLQSGDFNGIKEVLKINTLLHDNDSLCELVLLKGLYEMYYSGNFRKEDVKLMLNQFALQSKIDESKIIATDILASFSTVIKGTISPDFALNDTKGLVNSILDFRGKYLYLCFFKTTSGECLSELDVISSIYKKYGKKVNFVCISEDDKMSDLQNFLNKEKTFTWTFLFDEGNKVLAKYDVKTLPEFFLLNPQGKFVLSPADSPSHGIELTFDKLFEEKKKTNDQ